MANTDVDTVVIGSGAGGLTCALALAQAGQRVLVLEQHYLPGGWCHSFTLGPRNYRFSPGVHYIGELQPGGQMRRIYEGLGMGEDLTFLELNPDGFDHVLIGSERFDIPRGKERFAERLARRFPNDARGARAYIDTVSRLARELNDLMSIEGLLDMLRLPFRAPTVARWGLASARSLIDAHVRDPMLKAILAAQSGDHGLPPSLAPAAVHASVTAHYFEGGYYPRGGAYTIPRAYLRALKRAGGEIKVRTAVDRILVENRRAIGVRLADGTEIRARHVVSNADPGVTFGRLIGAQHLSGRLKRKLKRTRWSTSALSLFLASDLDVRAAGLDSGNYWQYPNTDVEDVYQRGMTAWDPASSQLPGLFLTCTTLKDPSKLHGGHHTMEAFTFVHYDAYRAWESSHQGERPADYERQKEDLKARMIQAAARIAPGLDKHVVFSELGTPLTNAHYCAGTDGNLYGTEKSRWQVGPWAFPIRTELDGLYQCGASTLSHGVMGATVSGLAAARSILHVRLSEILRQPGRPLSLYACETYPPEGMPEKRPAAPTAPTAPPPSAVVTPSQLDASV
jgi:phytoene dehydrogenase-like protein